MVALSVHCFLLPKLLPAGCRNSGARRLGFGDGHERVPRRRAETRHELKLLGVRLVVHRDVPRRQQLALLPEPLLPLDAHDARLRVLLVLADPGLVLLAVVVEELLVDAEGLDEDVEALLLHLDQRTAVRLLVVGHAVLLPHVVLRLQVEAVEDLNALVACLPRLVLPLVAVHRDRRHVGLREQQVAALDVGGADLDLVVRLTLAQTLLVQRLDLEGTLQHTVHDQVGVTPDRAGEVGVQLQVEGKVMQGVVRSLARAAVLGKHHATNSHGLDGVDVFVVAEALQRLAHGEAAARVEADALGLEGVDEGGEAGGVGVAVVPCQCHVRAVLDTLLCDTRVRHNHELLNQPVSLGGDVEMPALGRHVAVSVLEVEPQLALVQGKRSTLVPLPTDVLRNAPQTLHALLDAVDGPLPLGSRDVLEINHVRREGAVDDRLGVLVGKLALVPDHGLTHPLLQDLAVAVHRPLHTERQLVTKGVQRAVLLTQLPRQHGNHPLHHVNTRRPLPRFLVKVRSKRHKRRHVGDVHAHTPVASSQRLARERVVQVPGGRRVDRRHEPRVLRAQPHVPPALLQQLSLAGDGHLVRDHLQTLLAELVCVVRAVVDEDGAGLRLHLVRVAQHLKHLAAREVLSHLPRQHLHVHQVPLDVLLDLLVRKVLHQALHVRVLLVVRREAHERLVVALVAVLGRAQRLAHLLLHVTLLPDVHNLARHQLLHAQPERARLLRVLDGIHVFRLRLVQKLQRTADRTRVGQLRALFLGQRCVLLAGADLQGRRVLGAARRRLERVLVLRLAPGLVLPLVLWVHLDDDRVAVEGAVPVELLLDQHVLPVPVLAAHEADGGAVLLDRNLAPEVAALLHTLDGLLAADVRLEGLARRAARRHHLRRRRLRRHRRPAAAPSAAATPVLEVLLVRMLEVWVRRLLPALLLRRRRVATVQRGRREGRRVADGGVAARGAALGCGGRGRGGGGGGGGGVVVAASGGGLLLGERLLARYLSQHGRHGHLGLRRHGGAILRGRRLLLLLLRGLLTLLLGLRLRLDSNLDRDLRLQDDLVPGRALTVIHCVWHGAMKYRYCS
eukprot:Rhum_TRINITY_DN14437_c11_g1::Rhum_TRINITY_DN14437_c11_g1_i1::g.89685::m.89685